MNFKTWYDAHKADKNWMDDYMAYFYAWEGWTKKTNQDPLSYRAWMKKVFDSAKK